LLVEVVLVVMQEVVEVVEDLELQLIFRSQHNLIQSL
jgi:hypothetical protein